jgi:hypothetical protein
LDTDGCFGKAEDIVGNGGLCAISGFAEHFNNIANIIEACLDGTLYSAKYRGASLPRRCVVVILANNELPKTLSPDRYDMMILNTPPPIANLTLQAAGLVRVTAEAAAAVDAAAEAFGDD